MCDCLVALPLFAKNSDRPPDEAQRIEWLAPRVDDAPVATTHISVEPSRAETIGALISRPWWMWGVEHGVNEAGVAIGNETIYTTLDPRGAPPALTGMDLVRLGLERGSSASEAVQVMTVLLSRYGQGGTGHYGAERPYWSSFLIADPSDAWVLETSGREWATEHVMSGSRAISNRTTIPAFDAAHRHPRQPVATLVDPRLRASEAVLAAPPVTVDSLKAHLRSHVGGDDGWTVCMHVPDIEATTASTVVELGERPLAHMLLGSPCSSIYVPLYVGRSIGQPVEWERFAALPPSCRPELDALEASLLADVRDDDEWADEAWSRVEAELAACASRSGPTSTPR